MLILGNYFLLNIMLIFLSNSAPCSHTWWFILWFSCREELWLCRPTELKHNVMMTSPVICLLSHLWPCRPCTGWSPPRPERCRDAPPQNVSRARRCTASSWCRRPRHDCWGWDKHNRAGQEDTNSGTATQHLTSVESWSSFLVTAAVKTSDANVSCFRICGT